MINNILKNSCFELKRRIDTAQKKLQGRPTMPEVEPCYQWVQNRLDGIEVEVQRIERILNKNIHDAVLQQALYSDLSKHSNDLSFIDQFFLTTLYRLKAEDQFVLKLINWLHMLHPQTIDKPFIVANGGFSVAVAISPTTPCIYYVPVTSDSTFLHLPLVFHEFGHRLFQHHREELEDLIEELQSHLADYFQLMVGQDDGKFKRYEERAADIIETWREWMEEFFCDAVGLTIGGPSYLFAFSHYTRMGGLKEYFVPERQLAKRSHPVTMLRIHFLIERAKRLGWNNEASMLEKEWTEMAKMLGAKEDYFGFFEKGFEQKVITILDDMLIEANPITYQDALISRNSFLPLINSAWQTYQGEPNSFEFWEQGQIHQVIFGTSLLSEVKK